MTMYDEGSFWGFEVYVLEFTAWLPVYLKDWRLKPVDEK